MLVSLFLLEKVNTVKKQKGRVQQDGLNFAFVKQQQEVGGQCYEFTDNMVITCLCWDRLRISVMYDLLYCPLDGDGVQSSVGYDVLMSILLFTIGKVH